MKGIMMLGLPQQWSLFGQIFTLLMDGHQEKSVERMSVLPAVLREMQEHLWLKC